MKQLVLVGAGHAHAQILNAWRRDPVSGVALTLVSPDAVAPYSGMVPGWLAGHYRFDEIGIDFAALCTAAGCRWIAAGVNAVDPARQQVALTTGGMLNYDLLSLNIGATLAPPPAGPGTLLALRPLTQLRAAWEGALARLATIDRRGPLTVTAVGGGAAGVESLLAAMARLRALRPTNTIRGRLVTRGELLPGFARQARAAAAAALDAADVQVQTDATWPDQQANLGEPTSSDLTLWATGAVPQGWQRDPQRRGGIAADAAGFIRIDRHLRSISHAQVFAVGDCAAWETPLPKSGVYAVRMGPVLLHNLRAALQGRTLARYAPQARSLALLATGDRRAIASYGPLAGRSSMGWRWKDWIDRRFVARFRIGATRPDLNTVSKQPVKESKS